ncbi:MAG: TMEM165/GDT1 family protein [Proteobacteria bacterium]|nr:TMEM165/GDT1 family protein [Pseudomonadota bacterium]
MSSFADSVTLVTLSEMGDKTQLLALALIARYKAPVQIMLGIFVATVANHLLAAYLGTAAAGFMAANTLRWSLVVLYVGFAAWVLVPDKDDDDAGKSRGNAFMTTLITFFIAEMGDKTQLATVSLGAAHKDQLLWVTAGTTLGMMIADGLAVVAGPQLLKRIPMNVFRILAALLFVFFAARLALGYGLG